MSKATSFYPSFQQHFPEQSIPLTDHPGDFAQHAPKHQHGTHEYDGGVWSQDGEMGGPPPAPQHAMVNWYIDWHSPTLMLSLFVSATALAVGHHIYYESLDGSPVQAVSSQWNMEGLRNSQEWKIRFGSAFGFLVKAMFAGAVATAYQEFTWVLVRRNSISVQGLDALFSAGHNLLSFFNGEYLMRAKLGALVALLIWLIPLSALVTPATLTVVPSTNTYTQTLRVPTINFSSTDPIFNYTSSDLGSDVNTYDNGVLPYMTRLVSSTATSREILPMPPIANSTYNMTFHGPSFRCEKPSTQIENAIYMALNATTYKSYFSTMKGRSQTPFAWQAFAPPSSIISFMDENNPKLDFNELWLYYAISCITGLINADDAKRVGLQCEGITIPQPRLGTDRVNSTFVRSLKTYLNYGRIWVYAQNDTYDCVLTDTIYDTTITYSSSTNTSRVEPDYKYTWTDEDLHGNYFAIGNAVSNVLHGAFRGYLSGILSYKTRVSETAIFGAMRPNPKGAEADITNGLLAPSLLTEDITAIARNKTAGELIEELSRNITLSLFAADKLLNAEGTLTTVMTTEHLNVYSYNRVVLIVTYAVAFVAALVGILVGISSYLSNGVSHNSSFSAFMAATRNPTLNRLSEGQSLGSDPLSFDLARTKLRFGLLVNESKNIIAPDGLGMPLRRAGFGLEDEVMPLRKGVPCY